MTILNYQIFKTVTEMGSFQKAAEILGLTPSAISHAVAAMERELGFSVLIRSKAGVVPTNSGKEILPLVEAVLNSEKNLQQVIAEMDGLKRGVVRVGCFASSCSAWMPEIIREFGDSYPEIRIEVFQGTYDDVRYLIKNGIVDFGFLSASSARDIPIEVFYEDPLLCVTSSSFQNDRETEEMPVRDLANHPLVAQREATDADIQRFLKENDLELQANYHVMDDLSGLSLVAGGLGICILPELVVKSGHFDVKTYRMDPAASRMIGLAALNLKYMAPAARELYHFILNKYRNV